VVNWSMVWSMIDQFPKQGGGQLPPFRGALTARHPHRFTFTACAAPHCAVAASPCSASTRAASTAAIDAAAVTCQVTCLGRVQHSQAVTPSTRGAHSSPPAIFHTPSTNHSGGTVPCSTENRITPQHPQVTARTKPFAGLGSGSPDGLLLQPRPPERARRRVTSG
jgi:hypothetical protein